MKSDENEFKINTEKILPTLGLLLLALIGEAALLLGLKVFGTKLGIFLLIQSVLIQGALMLFLSMATLIVISNLANHRFGWIMHYIIVSFLFLLFVYGKLNSDLGLDISYTWISGKAGLDMLGLKYLHGWTIVFTFVLALLFILSEPRLTYRIGKDGKRHLYAHSKVISALRLILTDKRAGELIGENADSPIIGTSKKNIDKEESMYRYGFDIRERTEYKGRLNDLVRVISFEFVGWTFVKVLAGIFIASLFADNIANQYLLVRNYIETTGTSWLDLLGNYLYIAFSRMTLYIQTPLDFGITQAPTFEFVKLLENVIFLLAAIWTIRLILTCLGEAAVANKTDRPEINLRNIASNIFVIIAMWQAYSLLSIPAKVFIATTPYEATQSTFWFIAFTLVAVGIRLLDPDTFSPSQFMEKGAGIKIAAAIFMIILLLSPSIVAIFTVNRYIEGKREEYVWKPGNLPSIEYTRWAYEASNITRLNYTAITMNNQDILKETRIFNQEAAKLNMKPYVGANNWMSIDDSNVDIVYLDNGEKWASILTLISPPYEGDTDTWRAKHLLQTHSEKMLIIDAATTQPVDALKLIGGNTTPTFYYGEGGLWKETDEVYLDIPGYTETHLPEYKGPIAYDGKPDYVYRGFWRALKFFFVDWNYAFGNYGDIKTLVQRESHDRVSNILLPGMEIEPRAQPILDGKGNVYQLYWVTLRHKSPHNYADYPENEKDDIIRRFAIVLLNTKDGSISGFNVNTGKNDYLMSYYRTFYPDWNQPMPEWLQSQLRFPEHFFEEQIDTYNIYFQDNFQKYQRNEFYELTIDDESKNPIEDVRYIMMPFNGNIIWTAERPVEWYKGATRNLAGLYLAPGGNRTGEEYFIDFNSKTIIGPSTALGNVKSNTKLTNHPYFPQWVHGNILLYSSDSQYYVIPYYKQESNNLQPQMIAVVDAVTRASGYYIINDPQNYGEISTAVENAFKKIGTPISESEIQSIGKTIISETPPGNETSGTYMVVLIKGSSGEIVRKIPLGSNETVEIVQNK